jgi:hypothetical protein
VHEVSRDRRRVREQCDAPAAQRATQGGIVEQAVDS